MSSPAPATPSNTHSDALPLSGIRVLDFTQVMAGPFCTMLLADMGADIIKVEPPGHGDQTRGSMGFRMKGDDSLGFINLNRNKRSITVDLKTEGGKEIINKLVAQSDIVVENFRPGVMAKLGLDYETLSARHPELIYASISGFGQSGPWAMRPGYDLMAQAMSGVMSVTGEEDGPPLKAGVPVGDIGCALFTAYSILAAYIERQRSGLGQHIDTALMDTAMSFAVWDISEYWGTGRVPTPVGTANRMSAPYQAVRCADGHFVMGANNDKLWGMLCQAIGREELLDDTRFNTISQRLANRVELIATLEDTFLTESRDYWINLLQDKGIPAGPILNYAESFVSEQAAHRGMKMDIDHPVEGRVPVIGFVPKLSRTPPAVRLAPPLLGQHTHDILTELGISEQTQQRLRSEGVFGR